MEALWDQVQVAYLNAGKPLLYGLAVDDAHNYHVFDQTSSNPGRGWVMVRASELSPKALIEAMENGDFYSSTGVVLKELDFDRKTLRLAVAKGEGVQYTIQFFGADKSSNQQPGKLLLEVAGEQASYTLDSKDLFVRAKVLSSKPKENPYQARDVETAWIQPVTALSLGAK